jgi:hypothetical protein
MECLAQALLKTHLVQRDGCQRDPGAGGSWEKTPVFSAKQTNNLNHTILGFVDTANVFSSNLKVGQGWSYSCRFWFNRHRSLHKDMFVG